MNKSICLICEVKLAVHIMCLTGRFRTELCSIWTCWWKSWSRSPWPRWPLPLYTWQRSSLVTSCRAGVGLTSTASGKPHTQLDTTHYIRYHRKMWLASSSLRIIRNCGGLGFESAFSEQLLSLTLVPADELMRYDSLIEPLESLIRFGHYQALRSV